MKYYILKCFFKILDSPHTYYVSHTWLIIKFNLDLHFYVFTCKATLFFSQTILDYGAKGPNSATNAYDLIEELCPKLVFLDKHVWKSDRPVLIFSCYVIVCMDSALFYD